MEPHVGSGCHQAKQLPVCDLPQSRQINMFTAKKSWTAHAELLNVSRETLDHVAKNLVSVTTAETDIDPPYSFPGGVSI
jgi:hypothetical protein